MLIPVSPTESVVVVDGQYSVKIGLPGPASLADAALADDGTVIYQSNDGSADMALQAFEDGSVSIRAIIHHGDAPDKYRYPVELPEGARILSEDAGGLLVVDAEDRFLVGVAPPWAIDGNGNPLDTRYEVDDEAITQWVDLASATAFPVVADPYLGINLIDNVTRSYVTGQGYRYFVYPSWWGRSASFIARGYAWDEVKTYYSGINTPSLRDQFYCHFDNRTLTAFKGSWNLEAWRPHINYAALLVAMCNN